MIALHCVSSGEFSPTLLMGAVESLQRPWGEWEKILHSVGLSWSQGKTIIIFYYAPHVEHFDFIVCHT